MEEVVGKWRLDRSKDERVKEFLTATGVSESSQAYLMEMDPVFQWEVEGENIRATVHIDGNPPKSYEYKLGHEFAVEKAEDLHFKCVVTWDGRYLMESFTGDQGQAFVTRREVRGDVMNLVGHS